MNLTKLLRHAEKLVSYGKISDAIEVYSEILAEDFQNTKVHELIAELYIMKKDMQRASRHLFKVASDAVSNGDLLGAVTVYRSIIDILPKNILAREKMLEILTKTGSKNEIVQAVRELATRAMAEDLKGRDCLTSPGAVRDLLRHKLAGLPHEVFVCIQLDAQHRVIAIEELFRGTDVEILFQSLAIHSRTVVLHLDQFIRHLDIDLGRIGVVGVVDQFSDQLDALRIKPLSNRDQVAFIDGDGYVIHG